MASQYLIPTLAISLVILTLPTYAQIMMPCTPSMISTFTPCIGFVTSSSFNGTSPSADCCNSLKTLMNNGKDCLCQISTGNIPFNVPINRTLAVSLPRACNMPSVPLQCKASGAPAPAPAAFGPTISPNSAPSPTPKAPAASETPSPASSPEADATPTPPSPTTSGTGAGGPTSNTGNRAGTAPSAAQPALSVSPLLFLAVLGVFALKYY